MMKIIIFLIFHFLLLSSPPLLADEAPKITDYDAIENKLINLKKIQRGLVSEMDELSDRYSIAMGKIKKGLSKLESEYQEQMKFIQNEEAWVQSSLNSIKQKQNEEGTSAAEFKALDEQKAKLLKHLFIVRDDKVAKAKSFQSKKQKIESMQKESKEVYLKHMRPMKEELEKVSQEIMTLSSQLQQIGKAFESKEEFTSAYQGDWIMTCHLSMLGVPIKNLIHGNYTITIDINSNAVSGQFRVTQQTIIAQGKRERGTLKASAQVKGQYVPGTNTLQASLQWPSKKIPWKTVIEAKTNSYKSKPSPFNFEPDSKRPKVHHYLTGSISSTDGACSGRLRK